MCAVPMVDVPELKLGRPMTLEQSQTEARHRIRSMRNLRCAETTLTLPAKELEIRLSGRQQRLWDLTWPLVNAPWPKYFPQISHTEHHFEVFQECASRGFVLRVVRRGISARDDRRRYDLAELLMLIPRTPPSVVHEYRGTQSPVPFGRSMDSEILGLFVGMATDARIVACSEIIDFTGVRIRGRVIRRGSNPVDLEDGRERGASG